MRSKVLTYAIVLALFTTLGTTGCKWFRNKKTGSGAGQEGQPPPIGGDGNVGMMQRPLITGGGDRSQFAAQTVYFDYDSARIRPGEMSKLETVASGLKGNEKKLVVEGHCDERGTAEYNRALGERRAQAAREELVKMGIDGSRITTISYGKDRPAEPAHDEAGWAKNRRCEFVIVSQ